MNSVQDAANVDQTIALSQAFQREALERGKNVYLINWDTAWSSTAIRGAKLKTHMYGWRMSANSKTSIDDILKDKDIQSAVMGIRDKDPSAIIVVNAKMRPSCSREDRELIDLMSGFLMKISQLSSIAISLNSGYPLQNYLKRFEKSITFVDTQKVPENSEWVNGSPVSLDRSHISFRSFYDKVTGHDIREKTEGKTGSRGVWRRMSHYAMIPVNLGGFFLLTATNQFTVTWISAIVGVNIAYYICLMVVSYFTSDKVKDTEADTLEELVEVKAERGEAKDLWDELDQRHQKIITSWLEYEIDLELAMTYPQMLDSSDPATNALHRALVKSGDLRKHESRADTPIESAFYRAVVDLEIAFKNAEDNARKVGMTIWDAPTKKKVVTAMSLHNIAQDQQASPMERKNAYSQMSKNLEGVIALPEKGVARLQQSIGMIEA